ncbi:hypothetical protein P691DRAFT_461233 [Macrolepiota fuliginosa MF-IS2]|uniref:F-box domain-containing protein n=1 Tax=Macrolepiota fuliginosa MF-IS2 TaxID=1400762 RepID=A0A9P6BYJ1_9AGAR|nr:hypothetical protein P691DRAFT_461233 [Macrolepiota fuliginosa MF-IS2]
MPWMPLKAEPEKVAAGGDPDNPSPCRRSHSTAAVTALVSELGVTVPSPSSARDFDSDNTMNVVFSAVLFGMQLFIRPAYPHPITLPYSSSRTLKHPGRLDERNASPENVSEDRKKADRIIPKLPPELYSLIASYLSDDKQTLASCALISPSWLSASRIYLFHTITLTYNNVYAFLALLNPDSASGWECSFNNAVKVLRLREGEYVVDRWIGSVLPRLLGSASPEDVRQGQARSRKLGNVRVLDVYNLTWGELSPAAVRAVKESFASSSGKTLEALRVGTCYWECVGEFVEFVCAPSFVGLRHLVCDSVLLNCGVGCGCGRSEDGGSADDAKASREGKMNSISGARYLRSRLPETLESLYLSLPEESMLRWFVQQEAVRGLKRLGVVVRERNLVELVGQLVERAGSALEELILELPSGCGISLAENTSLKLLGIHIVSPTNSPTIALSGTSVISTPVSSTDSIPLFPNAPTEVPTQLPPLLPSISSPSLQTLIFDIDLTNHDDLLPIWPWRQYISAIDSLKGVKRVVFVVRYLERWLFKAMREVIKVECSSERGWKIRVRGVRVEHGHHAQEDDQVWEDWIAR